MNPCQVPHLKIKKILPLIAILMTAGLVFGTIFIQPGLGQNPQLIFQGARQWQMAADSPGPDRTWQWAHTEDSTILTTAYDTYQTLSFTPGEAGDYLIMGYADVSANHANNKARVKLDWEYNGEGYSTFSEKIIEQYVTYSIKPYFMIGRIQVSEANKNKQINARIQAMVDTSGTGTSIRNRRIIAIPLGTENTDYWYAEDLTGTTFSTTEATLLSITTTGLADGDYLVVSDVDCRPSASASYSGQVAWKAGASYLHGYWTSASDAAPLLEREDAAEFERWPFFAILTLPLSESPLKMIGRTESGSATYNDARMFLIKVSSISDNYEKTSSLSWSTGATSGTKNSITNFNQSHTGKYLIGSCSMLDPVTAGLYIQEELHIESTRRDGHYRDEYGDSSDIFAVGKWWVEDYVDTGSRNYYQKWAGWESTTGRMGFAYLFVIGEKSAVPAPVLTQNHYRWRDDSAGLNTDGGWLADINTLTTIDKATTTRLRVEIANTGGAPAANYQYRLEYATSTAGPWTAVPVTPTTEHFEMVESSQYSNNDNITSGFLPQTGIWTNGKGVADPSNQTANYSLTDGYYTEFEYAIQATANATSGAYYCFRLTNNGSFENFTYSVYPELQITPPVGITVSGTVYSGEETGPLVGKAVRLRVNGGDPYSTTTDGDGFYSIDGVEISNPGDIITVYLYNEEQKANTITVASSTEDNIQGLNLYQNRIIVRQEDSGPITITDLDKYDSDNDGDILYTAASSTGTLIASSTSEFFVWPGMTFGAWGDGGVAGTIQLADLDIRGTFNATSTQTIQISGNWDATTTATFNSASSTVEFTATTAKTIRVSGNPFWNLTFNNSAGEWTFQDAATTTNNLAINQGTASSTHDMSVYGGNVTGNGTLNWTGGTFLLAGDGDFGGANPWTFNDLTFGDGSSATTTATSTATTTISNILTISSNQKLYAGSKVWVIEGYSTSSTPFLINGIFNAQTSTFQYTTDQSTNITATTYYNLELIDPPKKETQSQDLSNKTFIPLETRNNQEAKEPKIVIDKIVDVIKRIFSNQESKEKKVPNLTFDEIQSLKIYKKSDSETYALKTLSNDLVEIGTETHLLPQPYLKINRWDGEVSLKVRIPFATNGYPENIENIGNKLKYSSDKVAIDFYPIEPEEISEVINGEVYRFEQNEYGGVEFDTILYEKPETNEIIFPIETKGLKFYYQPPLNEENKGRNCTETYCLDEDGNVTDYRPENSVGSYDVYHESKSGDYTALGEKNYRAGIAFRIYRPKIYDASGKEIWGRMNIDEQAGTLIIEINQKFLDNAVYPVVIDPTFGFTEKGSTQSGANAYNTIRGFGPFTAPENGTATKLTSYVYTGAAGCKVRGVIYLDSDKSRVTYDSEVSVDSGGVGSWVDFNITNASITQNTDYLLSLWIGYQNLSVWYSSVSGFYMYRDDETYSSTDPPPATLSLDTTTADRKYSIYCTYTSSEGLGPTLNQRSFIWQNDDGDTVGDPTTGGYVNQNTTSTSPDTALTMEKGERAIWRVQIDNTGDQTTTTIYKIQWATTSAVCSAGLSWADVGTSTEIAWSSGLSGTNGESLTTSTCASNSKSWVNGKWFEATSTTGSFELATSTYTEFGFMIQTANAATGTNYCLRLINETASSTLDSYTSYGKLSIVSTVAKRYSKDSVSSLPSAITDLTYFLDSEGYDDVATDDGNRDSITSSSSIPVFLFAQAVSGTPTQINATWNGQSSVAASSKNLKLDVYRFGGTNAWENATTNSSCATNTDCTLSKSITSDVSDYYDSGWTYWRAYQTSGNQILKTDYFNAAGNPNVDQTHYRWRNDDGGEETPYWLDSNWTYRKKIPIVNDSPYSLTDYQVKIVVASSTGGDITCNGHCQDNFDDIRFTKSDGTTILDYWRESYATSATTSLWVKIPSILPLSSTNIYMYYGNSSANSSSTIEIFDLAGEVTYFGNTPASFTVGGREGLSRGYPIGSNAFPYDAKTVLIRLRLGATYGGRLHFKTFENTTGTSFKVTDVSEEVIANVDTLNEYYISIYGKSGDYIGLHGIDRITWGYNVGAGNGDFNYRDGDLQPGESAELFTNQNDVATTLQARVRKYVFQEPSIGTPGSEATTGGATWKLAEDTAVTDQQKDKNIRVRFSIKNTGGTADYNYRLQYATLEAATSCEAVTSTNFSDVPTTTGAVVIMATSSWFDDKDGTTNVPDGLTDPTPTSTWTWTPGRMVASSSSQTLPITLNTNYFTENEYILKFTDTAPASTTYCFRMAKGENGSATALNSYSKIAEITTTGGPAPPTYTLGTTTGQILTVQNNLLIGNGTDEMVVTGATNNPTLDVNGNLTISASATFIAPTSSPFTVAGNWNNQGTFIHSDGTVTFDGSATSTIYDSNTFYNLNCLTSGKNIVFEAGATTTVAGTLTLTGTSGQEIVLRSSSANYWYLTAQANTVSYVDVQYSDATSSAVAIDNTTGGIDSGYNINWLFPAVGEIDISGNVYTNEGQTTTTDTSTIALAINSSKATTTSISNGFYQFTGQNINSSDIVTVFWDTGGGNKAVTVTKGVSASVTDFHLYQNRVIVRHEGASAITISDMDKYDNGQDQDILYTATTSPSIALSVDADAMLYIWPGKEFAPGGNVTLDYGGSGDEWDGSLKITTGATFTASSTESHSIGGNWFASSTATFTAASSTITFTATTTGKTITTAGNSFYKVQFNGSGGYWTITDPTRVSASNAADTLVIKQGTVQMGDSDGDDLEVLGKFIVGDGTGNATFTTAVLDQGESLTIHINASSSPSDCSNCIIQVGASSGSGTFNLKKNTILKFNSYSSVQSGLEVESTGYLWIEGEQATISAVSLISEDTASTTISVSGSPWSGIDFTGMHLRISNTASSTTAFGKIYDVLGNTANTITINATTSPIDTNPDVQQGSACSGDAVCMINVADDLITASGQATGRYLYNITKTKWYLIATSTEAATDTIGIITNSPDDFTTMEDGDSVRIVDGIKVGDTFEILDYARVTAHPDNHGYIYAKAGSETLIRYADISELGVDDSGGDNKRYGVVFRSVNGANANEGVTIEKSRIHKGYYGVMFYTATNNTEISNNAIYNNIIGFYLFYWSNNNTLTSNISYGNIYGFYLHNACRDNTFTSNNSYGNADYGFIIYNPSGVVPRGYNTLTSNNSYGNKYAFMLWYSTNNTLTSNNGYGNAYGFYLYSTSTNNTLTSNSAYGNSYYGIILYSSSNNNTLTSNNGYGNMYGFLLHSSNNNTLTSNNSYGNDYSGLYVQDSTGTVIISDNYGVNQANGIRDVEFNDSTLGSDVRCYSCTLASSLEVYYVVYSGAYFISFKHNGIATSTRIWGKYSVPVDNGETPQNEAVNKFNYADNLWEDSIARVNYYGTGSKDTNLNFDFGSGFATSSATYRIKCIVANTTWEVYRNEAYIGNATTEVTFTDSTTSLSFKIDDVGTNYAVGDTYTFVAFKKSDNQNIQKILEIQQADDKITVGSGKTLELKGGGGGANQDSQITHPAAGTWDFDVTDGTTIVQEATINDVDLVGGTLTVLNTILNNETVTSTAVLNVDWYLGVHVVDKDYPDYDIDTNDNDITISETTASSTVWKWNGTSWGSASTSQTTGSLSDGKIPHPATTTAGAIRIREYSMTSTTTAFYKYNLAINSQLGFDPYDYYANYGNKYITSTLSPEENEDRVISQGWQRDDISQMNTPYSSVNEPPANGSWYAGMSSVLEFTIAPPDEVSLILNLDNDFTTTTGITLSATTSHPNGFIVKAHMADTQGQLTTSSAEIIRFPHNNDSPGAWDDICNTSSTQCGFGYTTNDDSLPGEPANRFTNSSFCGASGSYCWAGFATSSESTDPVATGGGAENYFITLKTSVNSLQLPASYGGTIYFICTINY